MSGVRTAIVGATGAVGRTMLEILEARDYPVSELRLFASARSAGAKVETRWGEVEVEDLAVADPSGIEVALFSAGGDRSREYGPKFAGSGAVVIDNSSAFRMEPEVPLVVVGVNDTDAHVRPRNLIANPNCTTMALMMAAGPLHRAAELNTLIATSYQSVSGSGQRGIDELLQQTDALRRHPDELQVGGWTDPGSTIYSRPIGFNVIPLAGSMKSLGYTDEEWKLVDETRKILDSPGIMVEPTCVRVPVVVGHGIAATMFFRRAVSIEEALEILMGAPGVQVWTDRVPTPLDSAGVDDVLVGRVRTTIGTPGGLNLWVVGDNLRKGAALNAVQIAELLV